MTNQHIDESTGDKSPTADEQTRQFRLEAIQRSLEMLPKEYRSILDIAKKACELHYFTAEIIECVLASDKYHPPNLSEVSAKRLSEKYLEYLREGHDLAERETFSLLMAYFPSEMSAPQLDGMMERIIMAFYYMSREETFKKDYPHLQEFSMQDLANIFGRSTSTIHKVVKDTRDLWNTVMTRVHFSEENTSKTNE